jgi:PAS domain S-box-containing protein
MEYTLNDTDFLVSQTDGKGKILFANEDFCKIAGYTLEELIGQPHNIVRHRDMPRAAFKDLWETVKRGQVWKGYVKNATKNGGFYWVFATVYPNIACGDGSGGTCRAAEKPQPLKSKKPKRFIKP